MDSLEHNPNSEITAEVSVIKVRCPSCFRLYAVEPDEIADSRPQFECNKCQTRFWFPYPECLGQKEILGFPVAWLKGDLPASDASSQVAASAPVETTKVERTHNCPRCQASYSSGDTDCPKCGVVFAKLDAAAEGTRGTVAASANLRRAWHQVIDNYSSIEKHRQFVQACMKEKNILFASRQYARLLDGHSGDELALRMQKEIASIAEVSSGFVAPGDKVQWSSRLLPRVSTIIALVGGGLIAAGFLFPTARNLIGLGAAVVFLTLAIDWFFRKNI